VVLQAPWLVAAVTGPGGTVSDGAGVAVFAPDTESPFGVFVALLGLGGIWDAGSEPATRTTWLAVVAALAVVVVLVAGLPTLGKAWGGGDLRRWVALSGALGALAFAAATPWGGDVLVRLVGMVPGMGLLRDTQKFLAPAVVLVSAAFGAAAARACRALGSRDVRPLVALVLVLAPVLLLPDATTRVWRTVDPVRIPDELSAVAQRLSGADGVVVTLPWRAYRAFDWTRPGQTASDPAIRMVDAEVVTSDSLQVGAVLVPGESSLAADIGRALDAGPPARTLPPLGVTWVVLYADDREAQLVDTTGLDRVVDGDYVELYRVPGAAARERTEPSGRRAAVWGAHLLALVLAGAAVATRIRTRRDRDAASSFMYPNDR
jgi:hypothetical protein